MKPLSLFLAHRRPTLWAVVAIWGLLADPRIAFAQSGATNPAPVTTSLKLDRSRLIPGESTFLRAFARIVPGVLPDPDQIFSWNVDLLAFDPGVARIDPAGLLRPASDRDPATSSAGAPDGSNLRGIRDTFLNLPGAGRLEPVELFSVPILAVNPGVARFRLRAGSTGLALQSDFLVVPLGDGPIVEGGDYTNASVELVVLQEAPVEPPSLLIELIPGGKLRISMTVSAGTRFEIQSADSVNADTTWSPLPGGVAEGGSFSLEIELQGRQRFFRARQL